MKQVVTANVNIPYYNSASNRVPYSTRPWSSNSTHQAHSCLYRAIRYSLIKDGLAYLEKH